MTRAKALVLPFGIAAALGACDMIAGVRDLVGESAGPARDAASESDVATPPDCGSDKDPQNCGECGYECALTSCSNGRCAPFNVTTDAPGARGLALDDRGYLYWAIAAADGGLSSVLKGTPVPPIPVVPANDPTALAIHRAAAGETPGTALLYWLDARDAASPTIRRCVPDVGSCTRTTIATVASVPGVVALSAQANDTVCWTLGGDAGKVRCLTDNTSGPSEVASDIREPTALVATADAVYFGGADGFGACAVSGCVGPPAIIKTSAPVVALARGADGFVYVATAAGEVQRIPASGGGSLGATPSTIATRQGPITSIWAGDTRVYWTTPGTGPADGSLVAWTKKDARVRALAVGQHAPRAVVSDDLRVYWITSGEDIGKSEVWALPK